MLKTRKRWIALLTAVIMIAALAIPFVGTASASTTYGLSTTASVKAGGAAQKLTSEYLTVTMDNTSAGNLGGNQVLLELPSSPSGYYFQLGSPTSLTGIFADNSTAFVSALQITDSSGAPYTPTDASVSFTVYVAASFHGETLSTGDYSTTSSFTIPITYLTVPGGVNGAVSLTAAAPSNSLFASGTLTLANAGTGNVTLAAESVQAIGSGSDVEIGTLDVTESMPGALINGGSSAPYTGTAALELTLPPGFTWVSVGTPTLEWGSIGSFNTTLNPSSPSASSVYFNTSNAGRELDVEVETPSTSAAFFKLVNPTIKIDSSTAKQGNVTVTVGGNATSSPASFIPASYGTYALTDKAISAPNITAGIEGSTAGEIQFTEGLPGSLVAGRTIDLTLPSNCVWSEFPEEDSNLTTLGGAANSGTWTTVGTSGDEIELTVPTIAASTTAANLVFKNIVVTPAVDFAPGPLNVTVSGTEGLTGTLTIGNVIAGVTATSSATPNVAIGTSSAATGDLTITETASGNLASIPYESELNSTTYLTDNTSDGGNAEIDIYAPLGVTFFSTPTVTVTAGDVQLGSATTKTSDAGQGELVIPVKSTSTTASTIKISGIQVTIDRSVPEGPITFKIKGTAVDQTQLGSTYKNGSALFPNDTTAASVNVANVTTGTTGGAGTSVFTIGSTSYTLNGTSVSIDVAPYIKDSRTFLPLRYVANALGVADSNIMFDAASQKVTIIKGSLVAQFTIGSTTMLLNGAAITMDTAPEITSGRTCLPIAWVAEALNASIKWDATAQTVTITSN